MRMRECSPWGTNMHFPCFTCTGSWFFNTVHKFKISRDRPISLWKLKCLNLLRNGSNRYWSWKTENCRFYWNNVIWPRDGRHCRWRPYALFCGSRLTLLKKMYRDSRGYFFHGVSLFNDRAVHWILCSFIKKIAWNADFFNFLKWPLRQSWRDLRRTGQVVGLIFTGHLQKWLGYV